MASGTPALSPTPNNLLIGAGVLYLDRLTTGSAPVKTGLMHVGNAPALTIATEDTKLQKFSSMTAPRPLYAERLQRRLVTVKVTFDEFPPFNMALMLMGQINKSAQAATAVTGEVLFTNVPSATLGAALGGRTFRVARFVSPLAPITAVVVKVAAVTIVLGTDYTVDLNQGLITILPGSVIATTGLTNLIVDYTPTAITDLTQIAGGYNALIEVSGVYMPDNTAGPRMMLEFWRAAVKPAGDINLISDDYANMILDMVLQDDTAGLFGGSAAYPTHRLTYLPS